MAGTLTHTTVKQWTTAFIQGKPGRGRLNESVLKAVHVTHVCAYVHMRTQPRRHTPTGKDRISLHVGYE